MKTDPILETIFEFPGKQEIMTNWFDKLAAALSLWGKVGNILICSFMAGPKL